MRGWHYWIVGLIRRSDYATGLNGVGFESRRGQQIFVFSKIFMGPSGLLFGEVRGSFPGIKRPGREGNHSSI
jgi:hypothetical protein